MSRSVVAWLLRLTLALTLAAPAWAGAPVIHGVSPDSGPKTGDIAVVLSGRNFTGATEVLFAGVEATGLVVVNDTTAVCVTPPGMVGRVDVLVAGPSGTSAPGVFTYLETRPDPSGEAEAQGIVDAQYSAAERIMRLNTGKLSTRLGQLRGVAPTDGRRGASRFVLDFGSAADASLREPLYNPEHVRSTGVTSVDMAAVAAQAGAAKTAAPADSIQDDNPWALWTDSSVNLGFNDRGKLDLEHTTWSMMAGLDYSFSDSLAAGMAFGYVNDRTDVGSMGSRVDAERSYTGALYGTYSPWRNLYVEGAAGYTGVDFRTHRFTSLGFADGDRAAGQYFGSLAAGLDWRPKKFRVSPYTRIDGAFTDFGEYFERGGGDLALGYADSHQHLFTLSAGVKGEREFAQSWGAFVPSAGVEYTYNFQNKARVGLGYADGVGYPYGVTSDIVSGGSVAFSTGMAARFRNDMQVGLEYRGRFARDSRDQNLSVQFSVGW